MMNQLLISEAPLQFLPSLAAEIGVNQAIFLQQLHFRLINSKNLIGGKKWWYNTIEDWVDEFQYMSNRTIQRVVMDLRDKSLIETTAEYNKHNTNRTLWYTINYNELDKILNNLNSRMAKSRLRQNGEMDDDNVAKSGLRQCGEMDDDNVAKSGLRQCGEMDDDNVSYSTTKTSLKHKNNNVVNVNVVNVVSDDVLSDVVDLLKPYDINEAGTVKLIELTIQEAEKTPARYENFSVELLAPYVEQKIAYMKFAQTRKRGVDDPSAWLRAAIKKNYGEPDGYIPPELMAERAQVERDAREESLRMLADEQTAADDTNLYGIVGLDQEMTWAMSINVADTPISKNPRMLGIDNNHLTIGVSYGDIDFFQRDGSTIIDSAVERMRDEHDVETFELIEVAL
ncbi:MAG: hypothetical protein AAF639_35025 [Chloroflexota bacterium]